MLQGQDPFHSPKLTGLGGGDPIAMGTPENNQLLSNGTRRRILSGKLPFLDAATGRPASYRIPSSSPPRTSKRKLNPSFVLIDQPANENG